MIRAIRVTPAIAAALLLAGPLFLAGCQGAGDRAVAAGDAARSEAGAAAPVTLRIKAGGVYHLNGEATPVAAAQLAPRLERLASAGRGERVLRVLGEKGVVGYDVVIALQAARQAGFQRAEGIADYVEDGAPGANAKRWSQDLAEVPLAAAEPADTAAHP